MGSSRFWCKDFKTLRIDQVEMNTPRDRDVIERRFGPLGSGVQSLAIREVKYSLSQLLSQIGAEFDDSKPIDALAFREVEVEQR